MEGNWKYYLKKYPPEGLHKDKKSLPHMVREAGQAQITCNTSSLSSLYQGGHVSQVRSQSDSSRPSLVPRN